MPKWGLLPPPPCPPALFAGFWGASEEFLKSVGAGWCVELPKLFLSPAGVPAVISDRVIFGYLDLKGQSLEYFGHA